jgi:hypothetical protein
MKPTVYIETTIVGHLTSRIPADALVAGQMLTTRKWWTVARPHFEVFTSELVLAEASRGDPTASAERLAALTDVPLLSIPDPSADLADALVARGALPMKARVDAAHVAIAAASGMEYLLTWNCRHLANATLRSRIEQACRERGFEPPIICTPLELTEVRP